MGKIPSVPRRPPAPKRQQTQSKPQRNDGGASDAFSEIGKNFNPSDILSGLAQNLGFGAGFAASAAKRAPEATGGNISVGSNETISDVARGVARTNSLINQMSSTLDITNDLITTQINAQRETNNYLKNIQGSLGGSSGAIGAGAGSDNKSIFDKIGGFLGNNKLGNIAKSGLAGLLFGSLMPSELDLSNGKNQEGGHDDIASWLANKLGIGSSDKSGSGVTTSGASVNPILNSEGSVKHGYNDTVSSGSRTTRDTKKSVADLVKLAKEAGFNDQQAPIMAAIAAAESSGVPYAHNPKGKDNSYGLWQINMLGSMGPERRKLFGIENNQQLFDPETNAKAAKKIFDQQGFNAWSVYTSGQYKKYLGTALKEAKESGNDNSAAQKSSARESFGSSVGKAALDVGTGGLFGIGKSLIGAMTGEKPQTDDGSPLKRNIEKYTNQQARDTASLAGNAGVLYNLGKGITGNERNVKGLNTELQKALAGAFAEYKERTGRLATITSGQRSAEEQARISSPYMKARPGRSKHQTGMAVDVSRTDAEAMDRLGILEKYGLHRPLGSRDPVHIELQKGGSRSQTQDGEAGYEPKQRNISRSRIGMDSEGMNTRSREMNVEAFSGINAIRQPHLTASSLGKMLGSQLGGPLGGLLGSIAGSALQSAFGQQSSPISQPSITQTSGQQQKAGNNVTPMQQFGAKYYGEPGTAAEFFAADKDISQAPQMQAQNATPKQNIPVEAQVPTPPIRPVELPKTPEVPPMPQILYTVPPTSAFSTNRPEDSQRSSSGNQSPIFAHMPISQSMSFPDDFSKFLGRFFAPKISGGDTNYTASHYDAVLMR